MMGKEINYYYCWYFADDSV